MPWALEEHHLDWQRDRAASSAPGRSRPGAAERSIAGVFDADLVREAGRLGAFGLLAPRALRRRRGRPAHAVPRRRGAGPGRLLAGGHRPRAGDRRRAAPPPGRRPRGPAGRVPAPACTGETFVPSASPSRPAAPTPATSRTPAAPRRRRLGDQRGQAVHHQLRHPVLQVRDPLRRHGRAPVGRERPVPAPVSAFLVPLDAPGVTVGGPYPKIGLALVRHPPAVLRRRPGARRRPARPGGAGLPGGAGVPHLGPASRSPR